MQLPERLPIVDFSRPVSDEEVERLVYAVGRYDEVRPYAYTAPQYGGVRNIHVGIDLFAPVATPIHAFADGEIYRVGFNAAEGDYGVTLVTRHVLGRLELYALHGHLRRRSIEERPEGREFRAGEIIAWVGDRHENGGWVPHLHFQLSYERPLTADMPGVVAAADRGIARLKYPDPRLVLGPIY
jgi:murein DD-endopeptidase MepM/ murein hydrolase activator NlpD